MNSKMLEDLVVVKRSGQRVSFNGTKIAIAIKAAFDSVYDVYDENNVNFIYNNVIKYILSEYENRKTINVEDIQDIIENKLKETKFHEVYDSFSQYRLRRRASRETFQIKQQHKFVKVVEEVDNYIKNDKTGKPFDLMFKYGRTISKEFAKSYLIDNKYIRAHCDGNFFIHNLDIYGVATIENYHIDLRSIEANDLIEFTSIIKEILINIKKDISGKINIPNLDLLYKNILLKDFQCNLKINLNNYLSLNGFDKFICSRKLNEIIDHLNTIDVKIDVFSDFTINNCLINIFEKAIDDTKCYVNNLLEKLLLDLIKGINNIKTYLKDSKYSFSLSNDKSYESQLIKKIITNIIENLPYLENVAVIYDGSDIQNIIKVIYKNIYILNDEAQYFSTGEKVFSNVWGNSESIGKTINATTTINLPRIGLISKDKKEYFLKLEETMEMVKNVLLQSFELIANKYKENFDYLFNTDIFSNIDLEANQKIRKIIKNGSLQIGFVGLYESIIALNKTYDENLALEILKYMNEKCEEYTTGEKLNFILSPTNNKKVRSELLRIDKSVYGSVLDITDKNYYYSGFNCPNDDYLSINEKEKNVSGGNLQTIKIPKNISNKKLQEIVESAINNKVKFFTLEIQMGRDP